MILNMIFLRAESLTVPFHLDLVFFVRKLGQHSVQRSVNGDGQERLFFPPPLNEKPEGDCQWGRKFQS